MPNVDKGAKIKTLVPCNVCGRGWPAGEMTKLDLGKKTWDARICDGCTQIVVKTYLKKANLMVTERLKRRKP